MDRYPPKDQQQGFELPPIETQQHIRMHTPILTNIHAKHTRKNKYASLQKHKITIDSTRLSFLDSLTYTRSKGQDINKRKILHVWDKDRKEVISTTKKQQQDSTLLQDIQQILSNSILNKKKQQIGKNMQIIDNQPLQSQSIQCQLKLNPKSILFLKQRPPTSTHSFFLTLLKQNTPFLKHKYNTLLLKKVMQQQEKFKGHLKKQKQKQQKQEEIGFRGDFQSGNLSHVLKVGEGEYNVYVKCDTNTRGHQSWFYFHVNNHTTCAKEITINICNLRKKMPMVQMGQKIYIKTSSTPWKIIQSPVQITQILPKTYKLSFTLTLQPNTTQVSLLPPYTYSQLLQDITSYQSSPHLRIQILTQSLSGVSIPILTISKNASKQKKKEQNYNKKLLLIVGRVHPSQTCSSFIIDGMIRSLLSSQFQPFLENNVVKIVPMLNPDGVIFGNFRTNYLGDDLNRCFHHKNQDLYPQTTSLKYYGKLLQQQYAHNFISLLDIHGHSTRTNAFIYGPQHPPTDQMYNQCRILPKLIHHYSKYFSYPMSSFNLPTYKINTARGYFSRRLKIDSYTIQSSYGLYREKDGGQVVGMGVGEWKELGGEVVGAISVYVQYLEMNRGRQKSKLMAKQKSNRLISKSGKNGKNVINISKSKTYSLKTPKKQQNGYSISQYSYPFQLLSTLKQQIQQQLGSLPLTSSLSCSNNKSQSDSDCQSQEHDIPLSQKQLIIKSLRYQTKSLFLPRVIKRKQLTTIRPSIATIDSDFQSMGVGMGNGYISQTRNKPVSISHQYTQYLLKNMNTITERKGEDSARMIEENTRKIEGQLIRGQDGSNLLGRYKFFEHKFFEGY